jgi:hypothetical protein
MIVAASSSLFSSCSGTAGELFEEVADGGEGNGGGFGTTMGGTVLGAAAAGGRGGTAPMASNAGMASGGSAPLASAGSGPVLAGAGGGSSVEPPVAGADGNGASAGAGSGEPPPSCDPCPCSTGPFGEPELVAGLDSGLPAFGPAPSSDGLTLYFSSVSVTEDIFFATRSTRANGFSVPVALAPVNGDATEEGTPFIGSDDRSLYFFSTRPDPAAPGDRDLWVATRADGGAAFSPPVLVADVNTEELEHLPRLSSDGLTLSFVSGRDSPNLGSNIWQAVRGSLSEPFGVPVELPGVNSDSRDEGFWLSPDELTVFFASNRLVQADMDIWFATRDSVGDAFGPAEALDVVNTSSQDLDPALTDDGFELFFASNRSGTMQLYRTARLCP